MSPRYFGETSTRIQEAIAAVCSEQWPVVGAQQTGSSTGSTASMSHMATVDRRGSAQERAKEAFLLPALSTPLTFTVDDSSAIELLPQRDCGWQDFDLLLMDVQGKVDQLRRLAPRNPEVMLPLDELNLALQRTATARRDAGAKKQCAINPER